MNWNFFQSTLEHATPAQLAARYAFRGLNRVTQLEVFHGLCLTPASARQVLAPPNVTSAFVSPERIRREAADPANGIDPAAVASALAAGEACFGTFEGTALMSHLWLAPGRAHVALGGHVDHDPRYAFCRWAHTRDDAQGRHLYAVCKRQALDAVVARGQRGILSVVSVVNYPSLRSAERVGCVRLGQLVVAQAAGRRVLWSSATCRAFGMTLGESA